MARLLILVVKTFLGIILTSDANFVCKFKNVYKQTSYIKEINFVYS